MRVQGWIRVSGAGNLGLGFRGYSLACAVASGLEFRVWDLGVKVGLALWFRILNFGFGMQG